MLNAEEIRIRSHTKGCNTQACDATINRWLDWGDHTVTLDPLRNAMWVYDASAENHQRSVVRGQQFDAADVRRLVGWHNFKREEAVPYLPTTAHIDATERFTVPVGKDCKAWRGAVRDSSRFGELPVISEGVYRNSYASKDNAQIEFEMRESERIAGHRLFDCSGTWRHV